MFMSALSTLTSKFILFLVRYFSIFTSYKNLVPLNHLEFFCKFCKFWTFTHLAASSATFNFEGTQYHCLGFTHCLGFYLFHEFHLRQIHQNRNNR